ncbi:hypothetical protein GCM10027436_02100 [Actinophytocola sediminis]
MAWGARPARALGGHQGGSQVYGVGVDDEPPPLPAFFASAPGDGVSIADKIDDVLADGFGR